MKAAAARPLALVLVTMLAAGAVTAQTESRRASVYRCGPEGRDLRDSPCPDGKPAQTLSYDSPSEQAQAEARKRSAAELKTARRLTREREALEAAQRRQAARATGIRGQRTAPAEPAASAAQPGKKQTKPGSVARSTNRQKPGAPSQSLD